MGTSGHARAASDPTLLEVAVPTRLLARVVLVVAVLAALSAAPAEAKTTPVKATIALGHKKKRAAKKARVTRKARVAAPAAPAQCANTDLVPDAGNLELVRAALVCLHNRIRAQNGLPTLAENGALGSAGLAHSEDMVAQHYFDHTGPDGVAFSDRIIAARYAGADDAWELGENLAWGTAALSTPAGMMQSWMSSPGHRANILDRDYREIGLGIELGTPQDPSTGATVSVEFGVRG